MEYNRTKFEKLWREYEDEFWKEIDKNLNNFLNHITNVKKDKNCNPNNSAPKSIKGDYDLSIHGNKIVLVDNVDDTTVEARCHPDDDFDVGIGIKEAFKKLNEKRKEIKKQQEEENEIKIGDLVEVVDWKYIYPVFSDFFSKNNLTYFGKIFKYGCYLKNGDKLKVVYLKNNIVVLTREEQIGSYGYLSCAYLMNKDGLRKVVDN